MAEVDDARWRPRCAHPEGLVPAVRIDPAGELGPTKRQAAGPRWVRVAPGLYVPRERRPGCVEQRILEQYARVRETGAVTGWAALRWHGAAFFDGLGPGGRDELPVPLLLGRGGQRPHPASRISKAQLGLHEWEVRHGVVVTSVARALFDEVVRRGSPWEGAAAIAMTAAARLISTELFAQYLLRRSGWTGVPGAREAVALARDDVVSPREQWLHLVWECVAELPRAHANRAVFGSDGALLGVPDLLDEEAGLVVEYDGAHHLLPGRRRHDVAREEGMRAHGLGYLTVVRGQSRGAVATRMREAREHCLAAPAEPRAWTLEPPDWYRAPEPVHDELVRRGLAADLARPYLGDDANDVPAR